MRLALIGLGDIGSFLEAIGDAILFGIQYLVDFMSDIAYVIRLTGEFVADIPQYFSWLPSQIVAIIVSLFGIVVIYKIIGREG